jgi:hypothetical protein
LFECHVKDILSSKTRDSSILSPEIDPIE